MRKRFNNKLAFDYILENIDSEAYGITCENDAEKLAFVLDCFNKEVNYENNKRRIPNLQLRFADYLMGSPSCITIDFENYKILQIAKLWGSIPENATEKQEDKILSNWFNFISAKFFQLCNKNKVDYIFLH